MEQIAENTAMTLADLPVGMKAVIVVLTDQLRSRKKFADAGMIPGMELSMESHAPFGGLLRVNLLNSSMALHRNDCQHILVKNCRREVL